jgi:hypothetical protein
VSDSWVVAAAALIGAFCLGIGIAVRAGRLRRGVGNTYFNRELPGYQRKAMFALIPGGLALLLVTVGWASDPRRGEAYDPNAPPDQLGTVLFLLAVLSLGLFFWWIFRLPEWMKPAWVREYEHAERTGQPLPDLRRKPMSPRAYRLNWLVLTAMATLWIALHLPLGPLLIGLGFGMSGLLANRPRPPRGGRR